MRKDVTHENQSTERMSEKVQYGCYNTSGDSGNVLQIPRRDDKCWTNCRTRIPDHSGFAAITLFYACLVVYARPN